MPDHQFNESINGVFRQAKSYVKKQQKKQSEVVSKTVAGDGQRKISDMLPKKKLSLNVTNKVTKTFDDPSSSEDNECD